MLTISNRYGVESVSIFCINTDKEGNDYVLMFSYVNITSRDPKFNIKMLIITKLNRK